MNTNEGFRIRPYAPADRPYVRNICCETGFMGRPVDPVFCDREAFADFFTRYYTDWEPDHALVAEADGRVVGYLLGCLHFRRYAVVQPLLALICTAPRVLWRLAAGRYGPESRRFLQWFLLRSWRETPRRPAGCAHFHVNFLPEWRRTAPARAIIFSFLESLPRRGAKGVYGQIQTFTDRRSDRLFRRYGFVLYDRRRVTKFADYYPEPVFVSTFHRSLTA